MYVYVSVLFVLCVCSLTVVKLPVWASALQAPRQAPLQPLPVSSPSLSSTVLISILILTL
ncbi:hypothetical protein BO82DRAFT_116855 [Aspergillus uvarum CBS 121591]|uniref:Uncharacterized protein n=1 Tax=Aspergillus uvarum CBS 121591 TaxID=1448315 RepID=A0A319D504_9EURO|nr:hypothetical protein BO82DRAFT_116855 [Aspergillus uvarum CBS 121591]PYH86153.1 hypothetical protein BO82DRAFT_116855 [Aspergillus uvarum CBS 121591]